MLRIISGHSDREINRDIAKLEKQNTVKFVSMSTSSSPEKYSRYDVHVQITVAVEIFPKQTK